MARGRKKTGVPIKGGHTITLATTRGAHTPVHTAALHANVGSFSCGRALSAQPRNGNQRTGEESHDDYRGAGRSLLS